MRLNLSGTWQFALDKEKAGFNREFYKRTSFDDVIDLPTTTAEAKKGERGTERYTGYLTETYHFEGYAWYLKEIEIPAREQGKRFFFSMERTRKSTVWVDGELAGSFDSFYVEHRYELSKWLVPGKHTLVIMIDNTDYVSNGGHMTSPDTQTNWNGILGEITLESFEDIAIDQMWIYPSRKEKNVDIRLRLSHDNVLSDIEIRVNCRLTKLRMKEGRDFEHFEPLYTQTAETRREWIAQNKGQDLPYEIEILENLSEKIYEPSQDQVMRSETMQSETMQSQTMQSEILQSEVLQWKTFGTFDGEKETGVLDTRMTIQYPLGEDAKEWDEYNPYVYELTVSIQRGGQVICKRTSHFGLRDFTYQERTLYCNDKEIFLRGTHDAMIFPLTGYAPMDLDSWLHVYGTSREYGLNHYRYHTCCPPRAAFLAAAYLGIYVQAELAFWGSIYDAGDENYNKEQQEFLLEEGIRALDAFGDLPSYFGMSMGNELWGSKEEINRIMGVLKAHDNRHLYTQGSNNHQFAPSVLPNDDFFSGVRFSKYRLFRGSYAMCDAPLGFVQTERPGAYWNYDEMIMPGEIRKGETSGGEGMHPKTIQIQYGTGIKEVEVDGDEEEVIPHVPVVSHEIGQYEFTPDFQEIERYTGVLQPENMKIFRERMEEKGLLSYADDYFRASGKLAAACYKLELEAAFRSANLSGFQLLDIKDYSGQGTALVGILNAFNINKGAITRENWRMFCSDAVLLPTLDSFVMKGGDQIQSEVKLRYYRPEKLTNVQLKAVWHLKKQAEEDEGMQYWKKRAAVDHKTGQQEIAVQTLDCAEITGRGLFTLGTINLKVPECDNNAEYVLRFSLTSDSAEDIENAYDVFVYEDYTNIQNFICKELAVEETAQTFDYDRFYVAASGSYPCNDTDSCQGTSKTYKPKTICITNDNKAALEEWNKGESVLLFVKPNSTNPNSTIKGEYCTDFWCYPMFRSISEGAGKPVPVGTMGLLIDTAHPALAGFACEEYTTAQWYPIVMNSAPMILDNIKETKGIKPIVRMMDNFERNHNLGLIYEVTRGSAKMLVCEADLLTLRKEYPEAACLFRSLENYVQSDAFMCTANQ
ncbi:MAG: beta-glucuronidase [Lachnospiraceae bacterium]|nr:beta-glucuronidase [Lachnospiraceae bacterium]